MTNTSLMYQQLVDKLFSDAQDGASKALPDELLDLIKPWSDGWDASLAAWEEAGEPSAIDWPPQYPEYSDEEVAYLFNIPQEKVTDKDRIAYIRHGLNDELNDEYYSLIPLPVESTAGEKGTICLIIQIQGQGGPAVIDSWLCLSDSLELTEHGYATLDEITDEMILAEWKK